MKKETSERELIFFLEGKINAAKNPGGSFLFSNKG